MASRWHFFFAQFLWIALAFGLLVSTSEYVPAAVLVPITAIFVITGFIMQWGSGNRESASNDNTVIKALVTGFMWLIYVGAVMGGMMSVGAIVIPLAFIFMFPLLAMSAFMWDLPSKIRDIRLAERGINVNEGSDVEKRKRDRLDAVLRDLSDRDLVRLKQRLAHRMIDDEDIQLMLDDDGELVPVENKHRR
jgi:hypothetical protein